MKVIRSQREMGDEEAKKGDGVSRGQGQVTHRAGDMPQGDLLPAGDHKRMPSGHDEHLHICVLPHQLKGKGNSCFKKL